MKKIIVSCSIILLITIITCTAIFFNFNKKNTIEMALWYDSENNDTIVEISEKNIEYSLPYAFGACIKEANEKSIQKVVATQYYVGERKYYINGTLVTGQLLFKENSYYFFYKVNDSYVVKTLLCEMEYEELYIVFPTPAAMWINLNTLPATAMYIDLFFKTKTYQECKEFYSVFSNYVEMEDENEKILITGNNLNNQEKYEIILDFSTKSFLIKINNEERLLYSSAQ